MPKLPPALERVKNGDLRGPKVMAPPVKRIADPGGLNHKAGRK